MCCTFVLADHVLLVNNVSVLISEDFSGTTVGVLCFHAGLPCTPGQQCGRNSQMHLCQPKDAGHSLHAPATKTQPQSSTSHICFPYPVDSRGDTNMIDVIDPHLYFYNKKRKMKQPENISNKDILINNNKIYYLPKWR